MTGDLKLDVSSPESRSYIDYLELEQADVIGSIETVINRDVKMYCPIFRCFNGIAVELSADEFLKVVAEVPGILKVEREKIELWIRMLGLIYWCHWRLD